MIALHCIHPESNSSFWELGRQTIQKIQLCPSGCRPLPSSGKPDADKLDDGLDRLEREFGKYYVLVKALLESDLPEPTAIIPFPKQDTVLDNEDSPAEIEKPEAAQEQRTYERSDDDQQEITTRKHGGFTFINAVCHHSKTKGLAHQLLLILAVLADEDGYALAKRKIP